MPNRIIAVCKELTKKFEDMWRGYPISILDKIDKLNLKGEFVVVIAPINWK